MTWRAERPYNELPLLPPDLDQVESRVVLKACIPARAALAELRQAGELLPDPGLLMDLLPILEARDSSKIENIVTTTDELFRHANRDSNADPATRFIRRPKPSTGCENCSATGNNSSMPKTSWIP